MACFGDGEHLYSSAKRPHQVHHGLRMKGMIEQGVISLTAREVSEALREARFGRSQTRMAVAQ